MAGDTRTAGCPGAPVLSELKEVRVHELHPTQITVGMIEVHDKIHELEQMHKHQRRDFLAAHPLPAVHGVDDRLYITDHHHLGRALYEAGVEHAFIETEARMTAPDTERFWQAMAAAHWAHPIDERGALRPFSEIPGHLQRMRDDVYRSLAGYVRAAGGYDKTSTPFAEFAWADWFRRRIDVGTDRSSFAAAVSQATALALSPAASHLPGFRGVAN